MTEQEPEPNNFNHEFEEMEGTFFIEKLDTAKTVLSAAFIANDYYNAHPDMLFNVPVFAREDQQAGQTYRLSIVPQIVGGLMMLHQQLKRDEKMEENMLGQASEEIKESANIVYSATEIVQKHFKENPDHWISAEVVPRNDVRRGEAVWIDTRRLVVMGLNSFFEYLHRDLSDIGKNAEVEDVARQVYEKYRKKGGDDVS